MKQRHLAAEIFQGLAAAGHESGELFLKMGRSRRFELGSHGRVSGASREVGWAVRAGSARSSLFLAGSGLPRPDMDWPQSDGKAIQLSAARPIPAWRPPVDLDSSLVAESEAIALLEGIERSLLGELPKSRLIRGLLDEGTSETSVFNTLGVDVSFRSRAASLYLEAVGPWGGESSVSLMVAAREVRRLQPAAIARRLANRLALEHEGTAPAKERGEILMAPPVAIRMLAGLLPLLVGGGGMRLARRYRDRQGRIGSSALSIMDDGRYPGGVLEAPVDGEGSPTGEVVLVDEGHFCQALLGWTDVSGSARPTLGCMRRDSWRDMPRVAPSHLFIKPRPEVAAGSLVASVTRGYYLVEPTGSGRFDFEKDQFWLPVCGFALRQGNVEVPLAHARLEGSIGAFLQGIQTVARDLAFQPLGGMVGSPSLLVTGVGLSRTA